MRGRGQGQGQGQGQPNEVGRRDPFQVHIQKAFMADVVAQRIINSMKGTSAEFFVVGGAVRDATVGVSPKDIDLLVRNISLEDVEEKLDTLKGSVDKVGKSFGVLLVSQKEGDVEVAFPRKDESVGDSTKEFVVDYDPSMTVEQDLIRRDYTVNAMAWSPLTGEVIDPYGGQEDMRNGRLRLVREEALSEDPLRIIRGAVLHARYGLTPDDHIREMFIKYAPRIATMPSKRRGDELMKILRAPDAEGGIKMLKDHEVLDVFWDQQNPNLNTENLNKVDPQLRMAAMMINFDANDYAHAKEAFNGPENLYPMINHAQHVALAYHDNAPSLDSEYEIRSYLNRHGVKTCKDALNVRVQQGQDESARALLLRIPAQEQYPLEIKNLAVNGNDLIQAGLQPGPEFSEILSGLMDKVLQDPDNNNREYLMGQVANL